MKRFGWVAKAKARTYEEYKRLHADVWPDVLKIITECNLRNYSIFYKDGLLFTYVEYTGEDFEADMAKMAAAETTQKWWAVVVPMLEALDEQTAAPGVWANMDEIFHLD